MGIKEVRDAFLQASQGKLRINTCELHTLQDGNNSQRLLIAGVTETGAPFSIDSNAFDPKMSPIAKAQDMARGWLSQQAGFPHPPAAAGQG